MQIGHRTITGDQSRRPDIASAFARVGIPGHIFLEGNLPEVRRAVQGLVTVFIKIDPFLVPLAQRDILLNPRNPLSRPIKEGEWVRCLHGFYRGDIGFVCGRDPTRDADTTIALVPRIPERSSMSSKRKRLGRPEPRRWSALQVETIWGPSRVKRVSTEEYLFCGERYISGLILKHLPSASLANVQGSPNDIGPFIRASYIRDLPSFAPWVHRFAQDTIWPNQRVKVESGDHRGTIGRVFDTNDSMATVLLDTTGEGLGLLIPLRSLTPFYADGDHIKFRWSESWGTVMSVDEASMTLTYVEDGSHNIVSPTLFLGTMM